jgi:Tfp pilus assembly protein PilF
LKRFLLALLLLVPNAVYLFVRDDATLFYFANVVFHLVFGLVVLVMGSVLLPRAWRELDSRGRAAVPPLLVAGVTGLALAVVGATRPHYALVLTHVIGALLGVLLVSVILSGNVMRGPSAWGERLGLVLVWASLLGGCLFARDRLYPSLRDTIVNPPGPPLTMEGEGAGPKAPFFPSSAQTNMGGIIPANFFLTSQACGRCHRDIYEQWKSSAHHFSSFNNQWYRKSVEYMQDVIGTKPSKWCAGCHDHAVFFNGRFDRPIREQIHTPEAQAGLACTSCHSIVHVASTMGQGDFTIEYPPLHDLATKDAPGLRFLHDYLLREAPRPHRATFLKTYHSEQTPEFCSSCHKVHLDVPVNNYRWFRGFNEYDNWQASGVSGQGARSFYYPPHPQKCADCHMPLVSSNDPGAREGKIHSHRFPAANTALPFVNKDAEQLKVTQAFLKDGQVSLDLFGLVREEEARAGAPEPTSGAEPRLASTFGQGEESSSPASPTVLLAPPVQVVGPLDKAAPFVKPGESIRLEVVVRTRKVGHFFPGGTVDAFDVWVELEAKDDLGRTVFHSGAVDDEGRGAVDPGAHFYRSLLIDEHGNRINKRNAWAARSVAYVHLIPPGAADTVHYRLRVPKDATGAIHLFARLNYRKFSWWNTHWAFAGIRDPKEASYDLGPAHDDGRWVFTGGTADVSGEVKAIPDIPITTMATAEATLRVLPKGETAVADHPVLDRSVRERWNDYGIGLLLQGDLKAAEAAFTRVTEMDPGYADGWVNVARARIQEGALEGAHEVLAKALAIDPRLAKTHFFLGSVLKSLGRYDDALEHFRTAAAQYPRDRVVQNEIGRVLFLKRRYKEATEALERVLSIDPEDLQAHYNLMLCRRGLGDQEGAGREQALYERFKTDEASQFITGSYRKLHPEDNNERQAIHEHVSAGGPGSATQGQP